ncbi:hypothetical protein SADUNF_Sadunf01G0000700 [Salix dunnii]|uniref:Uncharacterized protein n=1 Tax=Salix dunnii TaxID=1413687 RepID=A0A835N916_9ROSI|nr:hypothetical protein SADUNF_Sadunf01G0000700 [Salix dunnii]
MAVSMVGKPLSCDEHTLISSRLEYAYVCVEVDASMSFMHNLNVENYLLDEPFTAEMVYKWKPLRCHNCKVFGHSRLPPPPPKQEQPQNP